MNEYQFPPPVPIYNQSAYGNLGYQDLSLPYEFRFPPPPLPNYNPVYNTSASYELPRYDFGYPPPAPNYYPISSQPYNDFGYPPPALNYYPISSQLYNAFGYPPPAPTYYPVRSQPYNVQEFGSTIPTPPGLGCWQPPPGFKYQCVQLPFPASGFWHPSLNMPPIGNEGMHSMHSVQLPPGAPVNQDRSQASTIDITTVSAQQLSLNQRKENHNEEKIKLLLRQISQFEDDNLDQAVASIFQEPKRKVISKRRMPRRPRPPVARQVCCYKDTMSVKKCNSKNRIKAPASQSTKKATLQPAVVVENSTEIKSPYKSPPPMIASVAQSRRSVQHLPRPIPRYACHISHYRE